MRCTKHIYERTMKEPASQTARRSAVCNTSALICASGPYKQVSGHQFNVSVLKKMPVSTLIASEGSTAEQVQQLFAKEATQRQYVTYSRIAISAIKMDVRKESIRRWESQWEETTKGAITKEFFPSVESRLAVNFNLSSNVTTIMTGHGNIRSYLHRFKIIGSPECSCKRGIQTVDHLIFECKRLKNERVILQSSVIKDGNWPVRKSELSYRYPKQFIRYINTMDFEKINLYN